MSHAATTDTSQPDGPTRSVGSGDGFGDWCATLDSMTPEQLADVMAFIIGKLCTR